MLLPVSVDRASADSMPFPPVLLVPRGMRRACFHTGERIVVATTFTRQTLPTREQLRWRLLAPATRGRVDIRYDRWRQLRKTVNCEKKGLPGFAMHWRNRLATLTSLLMLPRSTSWSPVGMSAFTGAFSRGKACSGLMSGVDCATAPGVTCADCTPARCFVLAGVGSDLDEIYA